MLFKFSSVLYFSKYHDSGRLQAAYSFSCFQGPCPLWRYLFILLYMGQSTPALPPLSLLSLDCHFLGRVHRIFLFSGCREWKRFYVSSRISSSVQNKEEPPAHFKKRFCLFLTLQKVTMNGFENILKWHCRKPFLHVVVLEFDDSCYVDAKQYRLASFSTRNSTLNTSLH